MSIVIIGGNECMVCRYREICGGYGHEAKVFCKMRDGIRCRMGSPDLVILFTATVSHKMVEMALREAKRCNAPVARCHSSSASALKSLLEAQAAACTAPAG